MHVKMTMKKNQTQELHRIMHLIKVKQTEYVAKTVLHGVHHGLLTAKNTARL